MIGLVYSDDTPLNFQASLIGVLNGNNIAATIVTPTNALMGFSCGLSIKTGIVNYSDYGARRNKSKILATQLSRSIGATLRASPSLRYRASIPYLRHAPYPTAQLTVNDFSLDMAQKIFVGLSNFHILTYLELTK